MRLRSALKWLGRGFALVLVGLGLVVLSVGVVLRGSLAQLDGQRLVSTLGAPVSVERDGLGVPLLQATNRSDLAFATGWIHAQDRFFQMDLMRRSAAGELAALLGPTLVDFDTSMRRHGISATARQAWESLPSGQREVLAAYAQGVNAGLNALRTRPPEYWMLRARPEPWHPSDSFLVVLAMFRQLQDSTGQEDLGREQWAKVVSAEALPFFDPDGSDWEAPLDNSSWPAPTIPGPVWVDRGQESPLPMATVEVGEPTLRPGSNSWGVDGTVSTNGAAIIANDMHLDLGLPNIWYHLSARWRDASGTARRFDGVTLPGAPVFVVGSNGEVAWAFTNATLDTTDVVDLELEANDPHRYRTPEGWRELETVTERIEVAGGPTRTNQFERTIWGPVISTNSEGGKRALRWLAHSAEAVNVKLMEMESVTNVAAALRLAPQCGIPVQNLLVGDRSGALAWTLIGRLPKRTGFDGRTPCSWADGRCRWDGWWPAEEYPVQRGARLWTANNRIMGTSTYRALGPHRTDIGARAGQIRDDLKAFERASEPDLFTIYRDDRALFLNHWQELLVRVLEKSDRGTNTVAWAEMLPQVRNWGGAAATNSVGYRLVRGFRLHTMALFFEPFRERARTLKSDLSLDADRFEQPLWRCLTEQPRHLLNPRFATYDALLAQAVNNLSANLREQGLTVSQATWGQRNTVRIQHPLSRAVPRLERWLDVAPVQLPGDEHMPRVQGTTFGSSERIVVSPGHEEHGLFQMPGGQSGHFLSPFYRAGNAAWETVTPTPLLPGPIEHRLILRPAGG